MDYIATMDIAGANGRAKGQIKLSELWVCNWGTFTGIHHININENGSLITGENGSGKSTMIDALMTLLLPPGKVDFNTAASQGSGKDRTLISYMRGSYARSLDVDGKGDMFLRRGSVVSVIKAVYKNYFTSQKVILTAVFIITGASDKLENVTRTYAVLTEDFNISDLLNAYKTGDIREVRSFLRDNGYAQVFDNFAKYSSEFRAKLHMDNRNAPALLSRALGLKKIDDLTSLIRRLVLEPSSLKADAESLINQFDSLKNTHDKLIDLREQETRLKPLPEMVEKIKSLEEEFNQYQIAISSLSDYIPKLAIDYYTKELNKLQNMLEVKNKELSDQKEKLDEAKDTVIRHVRSLSEAGGDKLVELNDKLSDKSRKLNEISAKKNEYETLTSKFDLPKATDASIFSSNALASQTKEEELENERSKVTDKKVECKIKAEAIAKNVDELQQELEQLSQRSDSNMDIAFHKLRERLSKELDIPLELLMFTAELMEVKEKEQVWQGAIERALGGIRQTLLVPSDRYKEITSWLNEHHTNLHVRVQVVQEVVEPAEFKAGGFLEKLNWKDHIFSDFLKNYLVRHDLKCVSSVQELNNTEFSMTKEGLIQRKSGFFEKKDLERIDDKRKWCLGFSSKEKREQIQEEIIDLKRNQQQLLNKQNKYDQEAREMLKLIDSLKNILRFLSFSEIDTVSVENEITNLKNEIQILRSNPDLKLIEELLKKAQIDEELQQDLYTKIYSAHQAVEKELSKVQIKLTRYTELKTQDVSKESESIYEKLIKNKKLTTEAVLENNILSEILNTEKAKLDSSISNQRSKISREVVAPFKGKWEALANDWGEGDNNYYYDYIKYYEKIVHDSLPELVEQFKEEMNIQISQSIISLLSKMKTEVEEIKANISRINSVLRRVDFKNNSYLVIEPHEIKSPTVDEFNTKVKAVTALIESIDNEKKFKAINNVIGILTNVLTTNATMDSKKLLDPRLRMEFIAKELDRTTDQVKDVLDSSSGKSGGEKESFACTVMAASLAYVLTPQNYEAPVYASVFLDEAFSNTSEVVSRRVLRIFKELKIHINLITPYKNIEVAREYARSLILMDKNNDTNESSISELTWEEFDNQLKENKELELQEAKNLGIEILDENTGIEIAVKAQNEDSAEINHINNGSN